MARAQSHRLDRIADAIQKELARLIQYEVKDPLIQHIIITVAAVKVTRDLAHAKIYISLLENDKASLVIERLTHAAGYLRTQLAQAIKLRLMPQLHFVYDQSELEAQRMSHLVKEAMQRTSENDNDDQSDDHS